MNNVDYELGLATIEEGDYYHSDEDFDNAEGKGKALLVACNTKCNVRHPFNRTKRVDCKKVCSDKHNVREETGKIFGANKALSDKEEAERVASAKNAISDDQIANKNNTSGSDENNNRASNGDGNGKKGLSTGAMVGIGVGVLALGIAVVLLLRKKKA